MCSDQVQRSEYEFTNIIGTWMCDSSTFYISVTIFAENQERKSQKNCTEMSVSVLHCHDWLIAVNFHSKFIYWSMNW